MSQFYVKIGRSEFCSEEEQLNIYKTILNYYLTGDGVMNYFNFVYYNNKYTQTEIFVDSNTSKLLEITSSVQEFRKCIKKHQKRLCFYAFYKKNKLCYHNIPEVLANTFFKQNIDHIFENTLFFKNIMLYKFNIFLIKNDDETFFFLTDDNDLSNVLEIGKKLYYVLKKDGDEKIRCFVKYNYQKIIETIKTMCKNVINTNCFLICNTYNRNFIKFVYSDEEPKNIKSYPSKAISIFLEGKEKTCFFFFTM